MINWEINKFLIDLIEVDSLNPSYFLPTSCLAVAMKENMPKEDKGKPISTTSEISSRTVEHFGIQQNGSSTAGLWLWEVIL